MTELTQTFDVVAQNALLQSSLIFLTGLLIARFAVRRPARVHTILLLTFVAAIVAPLASEVVRRVGWGVLPPEIAIVDDADSATVETAKVETANVETSAALETLAASDNAPSHDFASGMQPGEQFARRRLRSANAGATQEADRADDATSEAPAAALAPASSAATRPATAAPAEVPSGFALRDVSLRNWGIPVLIAAWALVSAVLVWRLLRGALAGRILLRSAVACDEPAVLAAVAAAREWLGLNDIHVDVYQSAAVHCPMIWCWSTRPRLLLPPESVHDWSAATWTPILCHELAHWKRRDHWAALAAELICCLMPWQALAWWGKRRLEHASEQACDDWTVALGHSPVDYAETLLSLVAQTDPSLALAALRRRSGLAGRIQHILTQSMPHPRLGRMWAAGVLAIAVSCVTIAAVCQRGMARADSPTAPEKEIAEQKQTMDEKTTGEGKTTPDADAGVEPKKIDPTAPRHVNIRGKVTADDKAVADAEVFFELHEKFRRAEYRPVPPRIAGTARTDAAGAFSLEVDFIPDSVTYFTVVAKAPGYGVTGRVVQEIGKIAEPIELRLEPSAPVEGTIFTPDGAPVENATVALTSMSRGSDQREREKYDGWYLSLTPQEDKLEQPRQYWPAAVKTDAQGKFRLSDAVPRRAVCELIVLAPNFPRVSVPVRQADAKIERTEVPYREPGFTLVLETPYVVNGRFLDEATGEPIANAHIEVDPYHYGRGFTRQSKIETVSDADGRYTLRVGSSDGYSIKVKPPLGYPGISNSVSMRQLNTLASADRVVKYEVKLRKGTVVKGRVIDADSGQGVAGAQVFYKPEANRKLGFNSEIFPVTTADDGSYEMTMVEGKGFLLVDAPEKGYYRLAVLDKRVDHYREGIYPHGLLEVDISKGDNAQSLEIPLKRGPKFEVRALAPNGKPVEKLRVACAEMNYEGLYNGEDVGDGVFRLNAAEPGRKYLVFLNCESAKAGGVFEIVAPADGKPVDVTMQPWATIRGRYVYKGGTPAPEITNFTKFRLYADREPEGNAALNLPFYDNFSGHQHKRRETDAEGNWELDGIIPGAFIYLSLNNEFDNGKTTYGIGVLKPGEVKDMGDLTIHAR